jgi:putative salt-induced outer membrane protein YdiY
MRKYSLCSLTLLFLATIAARSFALEPELPPIARLSEPAKDLFPALVSSTNHVAWKGSATVGATMTRGNSDSVVATAKMDAQRRSAFNELILGADGAYGEASGVKNYESIHGFAQDNHFFTPRFFGFLRGDGLHDGIKDIDYRYTLSPGAGYYLLRETNLNFAMEAGPSMIAEKQDGSQTIYAGARIADRFEYKLNSNTRFWETTEAIPQIDQFDNFIINGEAGVETAITKKLSLQIYMQDNYVNQPAPGFKFNDIRLVSGLTFKF